MTDIKDPVPVTLAAGHWLVILGLLGRIEPTIGQNAVDRLYDQLAEAKVVNP